MNQTIAFFQHLHRAGAYAYYHALPDRRSWWYPTDTPLAPPAECASNWYIGVHPCSAIPPANAHGEVKDPPFVRGQKRYIAAINCLYGEFDEKTYGSKDAILRHIEAAPWPAPSVVVDSGGGIHGYWLLRDPWLFDSDDARQAAELVQRAWVQQVIGADASVHDLPRILRVPGTLNFKYDPPRAVHFLSCDLEKRYPIHALTAHLPPVYESPPRFKNDPSRRARSVEAFNRDHRIGDVLERYGYTWKGPRRMVSPHSGGMGRPGRDGVTIDASANRAYVHTGGDPLCDGYWKKPFDVVCTLDHRGDFQAALESIRG
jgi:hypothetical protein